MQPYNNGLEIGYLTDIDIEDIFLQQRLNEANNSPGALSMHRTLPRSPRVQESASLR